MKLTAEQRIQRAHVAIMRSKEFCLLSGVLLCGKISVADNIPTAATNGWDTIYGREFVDGLTDKQLNFVAVHEAFHRMLKQLSVWKKLNDENPRLANMAADYVINLQIRDCDPKGETIDMTHDKYTWLIDDKYAGMDTRQVFELLKQESKGSGSGGGGDDGDVVDEHTWGDTDADGQPISEKEVKARAEAIDQAIRQGVILAGKMNANVPRSVVEITTPKVDWKDPLRDFVTALCDGKDMSTWRRPSRRWMAQGTYMPSMYSETIGPVVAAIDASGSIDNKILGEFLSEVVGLCETVRPESLHLLWWDTEVAGHQTFKAGEYDSLVAQAKPAGGGGTNVGCVFKYIADKDITPAAVIVLTDGHTPWCGAPAYPVLFGINTGLVAPFGVTIAI